MAERYLSPARFKKKLLWLSLSLWCNMTTETIMVIDDDQDLRESIVEILEDNDFTVVGCESAEVALQKIKLEIPHVIILDNIMPGMGGHGLHPTCEKQLSER